MLKVSCFVDFSNLMGSLKAMNLEIHDYQDFFTYILSKSYHGIASTMIQGSKGSFDVRLNRIYWYAVGSCDKFDFNDANIKKLFREWFLASSETKSSFMSSAGSANPGKTQGEITDIAFEEFYCDRKSWYQQKCEQVEGFRDFYNKIRRCTDFIDITEGGYWTLDFVSRSSIEKGVDTALAVDCVTMVDTYDIAIIVSGDADMIPAIKYVKKCGKLVGLTSFIKGHPPEKYGAQQSKRLLGEADFETMIYETDLSRETFLHEPHHSTRTTART